MNREVQILQGLHHSRTALTERLLEVLFRRERSLAIIGLRMLPKDRQPPRCTQNEAMGVLSHGPQSEHLRLCSLTCLKCEVMELVRGGELFDAIVSNKPTPEQSAGCLLTG